ncbi:MAG: ABC transporter permease [Desertimonas sp.]
MSAARLPRWLPVALGIAPAGFLIVLHLWPFTTLIVRALSDGVGDAADVFGRARTWRVIWFTTWQAVLSTVITLVVGLTPAFVLARFRFPGRRLLGGLLTAAFVMPTVVMGAAMLAVLPASLERGVVAILAAHVTFNLAVVVRTVGAVWEHLPEDMESAAATLGASPWRVAREITIPLIRPAIVAAAAIVFGFTFTSYGVIRVLGDVGTSTVEVEIWRRATQLGDLPGAAVLALAQLLVVVAVVAWTDRQQRRHTRALGLRTHSPRRPPRPGHERRLVGGTGVVTTLIVVAPLVALVERSLRTRTGHSLEAWRTLGQPEVRRGIRTGADPLDALVRSLTTTGVATVVAVTLGGLAALTVAAGHRRGRVLDVGLMLPLATSAVTIGFGMLITFNRDPLDWRASWWLVPLGHAMVAVPFVVRVVLPVLRGVDPALSEAAATLGASPVRAWREIVVPHLWRPLTAAAGVAAAISLGEFGATSMLARRDGETLPVAIERLLGRTGTVLHAQAYCLAVILAVATVVVVVTLDGGDGAHRS